MLLPPAASGCAPLAAPLVLPILRCRRWLRSPAISAESPLDPGAVLRKGAWCSRTVQDLESTSCQAEAKQSAPLYERMRTEEAAHVLASLPRPCGRLLQACWW